MVDLYSFGVLLAFLFTGRHSPVVPADMQVGGLGQDVCCTLANLFLQVAVHTLVLDALLVMRYVLKRVGV